MNQVGFWSVFSISALCPSGGPLHEQAVSVGLLMKTNCISRQIARIFVYIMKSMKRFVFEAGCLWVSRRGWGLHYKARIRLICRGVVDLHSHIVWKLKLHVRFISQRSIVSYLISLAPTPPLLPPSLPPPARNIFFFIPSPPALPVASLSSSFRPSCCLTCFVCIALPGQPSSLRQEDSGGRFVPALPRR